MMNIKNYLNEISPVLIDKIDAYALLSHYLNKPSYFMRTHSELELSEKQISDLNQLVHRRNQGEPLAYILKHKEFYGRDFKVSVDTLIPRPETELMVEFVLNWICKKNYNNLNYLDLGTGTSCIPISILLELQKISPKLKINCDAVDFFQKTLAIAQENIEYYQVPIHLIHSNWFESISKQYKYDVITSNPPYIAYECKHIAEDVKQFEPHQALFSDDNGIFDIQQIIQKATSYLNHQGLLIIEHGFNQKEIIQQLFKSNGFSHIETVRDYADLDRLTYGVWLNS